MEFSLRGGDIFPCFTPNSLVRGIPPHKPFLQIIEGDFGIIDDHMGAQGGGVSHSAEKKKNHGNSHSGISRQKRLLSTFEKMSVTLALTGVHSADKSALQE